MSKEIAETSNNPLAIFGLTEAQTAEVPAFARADAGAGDENVHAEDQSTVTLSLLQPMSPGVATSGGKLQPGQWKNSITQEVYDELYVANIFFEKQFSLFYKRTAAKDGLVDVFPTLAEADAALRNHPESSQIEIVENGVHYVVAYDANGIMFPARIFMKGTGLNISRDWNTQLANVNKGGARFLSIWKLSNEPRSNSKGSWWVPAVQFVGHNQDAGLYEATRAIYQALAETKGAPVAAEQQLEDQSAE